MDIPLQPGDREILVQIIEEELDAAEEVERGIYEDRSIDDAEQFLIVVTDHTQRTEHLRALRERLSNAA